MSSLTKNILKTVLLLFIFIIITIWFVFFHKDQLNKKPISTNVIKEERLITERINQFKKFLFVEFENDWNYKSKSFKDRILLFWN